MNEEREEQQKIECELEMLKRDLETEKKRSEEYLTRLKYMQADFENLKKRFDREMEEVKKYCSERVVVELLSVVDELDMAIKSGRSSNSVDKLVQGVEMTLMKLNKILRSEGVSPIESVGKSFDPSRHNAVAKVEKEGVKECTVIEEIRKGYVMKEKVIRPSIVKVVVKPASKPQTEMNSHE